MCEKVSRRQQRHEKLPSMQRVKFYLYVQASKKQLVKGKVAMVFAVIETLDTQGSDASVTLRDKSGTKAYRF